MVAALTGGSPASLGFHMPPEWAPHAGTWLSWPHNPETWPHHFAGVEPAMAEVVAALAAVEQVHINVLDAAHGRHVMRLLAGRVPPERVSVHVVPTNDAWIRDHGCIFVVADDPETGLAALDFGYNAWGGKYPPYDLDTRVAARMAEILSVPVATDPMVLEGGSIDVNGGGLLLTTEQCLLNPNRNPALGRAAIEDRLRAAFGVERILWLGDGIVGDDTDGHVDDLTRFVAVNRVVTAVESDPKDPNYQPLRDNLLRLQEMAGSDGLDLDIVELPMPAPQFDGSVRLPASYANFYIANDVVLMPAFDCPADAAASAILGDCFPGRRIVPIDCRALVAGLGALHCLTQQVPAIVARAAIS
jgi:agmatine deiminase